MSKRMTQAGWFKAGIVVAFIVGMTAFFALNLGQYLSFDHLKAKQHAIRSFYQGHAVATVTGYVLVYVLLTALSLPGATIMTVAGGMIFGFVHGTLLVSFASTLGATLAFLSARYVMKDAVMKRFGDRLITINHKFQDEGAFYLFSMRLIPVIPYFVINLVMGITSIATAKFFLVSQLGMLPGTMVYVNAGTQIAKLNSLRGILSFELIVSFALLGFFPLLAKKLLALLKRVFPYKRI